MNKKYIIDETIFEKIDSEWKAYFLGWMYADGNIDRDINKASISLQERDKHILDNFNNIIFQGKSCLSKKKTCLNGKAYNSYVFSICRKKIVRDLIKLGVFPCKSLTLDFPKTKDVPNKLMCHFIRGYFEGDGTIKIRKDGRGGNVAILGSDLFIKKLRVFLQSLNFTSYIYKKGKISNLCMYGLAQMGRFYDYLYEGASFTLERKRERLFFIKNINLDLSFKQGQTSKYVGVSFYKRSNKWLSFGPHINKVVNRIGLFNTEEEAYRARKKFIENKQKNS